MPDMNRMQIPPGAIPMPAAEPMAPEMPVPVMRVLVVPSNPLERYSDHYLNTLMIETAKSGIRASAIICGSIFDDPTRLKRDTLELSRTFGRVLMVGEELIRRALEDEDDPGEINAIRGRVSIVVKDMVIACEKADAANRQADANANINEMLERFNKALEHWRSAAHDFSRVNDPIFEDSRTPTQTFSDGSRVEFETYQERAAYRVVRGLYDRRHGEVQELEDRANGMIRISKFQRYYYQFLEFKENDDCGMTIARIITWLLIGFVFIAIWGVYDLFCNHNVTPIFVQNDLSIE